MDLQFERNVPGLTAIDLGQLAPGYYRLRIEPAEASARVQDHLLMVRAPSWRSRRAAIRCCVGDRPPLRQNRSVMLACACCGRSGGAYAVGATEADGTLQVELPPQEKTTNRSPGGFRAPSWLLPTETAMQRSRSATGPLGQVRGPLVCRHIRSPAVTAHIYSTAIYRPGQTVHLKGIVRADDDAHYASARGVQRHLAGGGQSGPSSELRHDRPVE